MIDGSVLSKDSVGLSCCVGEKNYGLEKQYVVRHEHIQFLCALAQGLGAQYDGRLRGPDAASGVKHESVFLADDERESGYLEHV